MGTVGNRARVGILWVVGAVSGCTVLSTEGMNAAQEDIGPACLGRCNPAGDIEGLDYEFVVVGSGAGGGPLAVSLAKKGRRVLLLEAGEDVAESRRPSLGELAPYDTYHVPALHTQSTEDPTMRWDYFVDHYDLQTGQGRDRALRDDKITCEQGGRQLLCRDADPANGPITPVGVLYPRAGTLGGCTSHNAMITVYPHANDWNYVAELTGDESWRAENMRQYFGLVERNRYLESTTGRDHHEDGRIIEGSAAGHGESGWLQTELANANAGMDDRKLRSIVAGAAFVTGGLQEDGIDLFNGIGELLSVTGRDLNTTDPARDSMQGLFRIPLATENGRRNGTREAILRQAAVPGTTLTVRLRSLVTNVRFADQLDAQGQPRAIGVDFLAASHQYQADPNARHTVTVEQRRSVTVSNEVILSAGAFNTPQLLMLSGIGPAGHLADEDVPCIGALGEQCYLDRPGVGTNLQDRYEVGLVTEVSGYYSAFPHLVGETKNQFSILKDCTFGAGDDQCMVKWEQTGDGPYASNGGVVGLVYRGAGATAFPDLDPSAGTPPTADPDLFIFGLPSDFRGYRPGYSEQVIATKKRFTWAVLKAHTNNTGGTVRLRSNDPRERPEIDFHYFEEGTSWNGSSNEAIRDPDLQSMVDGVQVVRRIIDKVDGNALLSPFGDLTEVYPGRQVDEQAEIAEFVRNQSWGHHASCTAPIGRAGDPNAVLDSHFRVQGTSGLRVVDASVFPRIPGFFIVVPIYMVSEKAAIVIDLENPPGSGTVDGGGGAVSGPAEVEPNDSPAEASAVGSLPANVTGTVASGDTDHFSFEVTTPGSFLIETRATGSEPTDTVIQLFGPDGSLVGEDDDGAGNLMSRLSPTLALPGRYVVMVRGYGPDTSGSYLLHVESTGALAD